MKISFSTLPGNLTLTNGYGYAGFNMVRSLQDLGHEVPFKDPDVKVQIHFSQPTWYDFHPNQYKIGYTPWESSELPDGWVDTMNECNEIWTPSSLVRQWYEEAGVKPPIHIYQHGVEPKWAPLKRPRRDKIRFLHVGEPAPRKGGQVTLDAFRAAFGDRKDVSLTIKSFDISTIRVKDGRGSIIGLPHELYDNVRTINKLYQIEQLIALHHSHDVLVYPSWGEGFGLIPLQAMATGMITICTEVWAPYQHLLLEACKLSSKVAPSPWPMVHPGNMFEPSKDHLVEIFRNIADNFDSYNEEAFRRAEAVHREYNWLTLTEQAFEHIIKDS